MTTDPTPLQERVERILAGHPILPPTYAGDDPIARKRERTAARIAEEVAAEVRKAQADAWDEGYGDCWTYHQSEGMKGTERNPYREQEN